MNKYKSDENSEWWLEPMLLDDTPCGYDCPPDGELSIFWFQWHVSSPSIILAPCLKAARNWTTIYTMVCEHIMVWNRGGRQ